MPQLTYIPGGYDSKVLPKGYRIIKPSPSMRKLPGDLCRIVARDFGWVFACPTTKWDVHCEYARFIGNKSCR